MFNRKRSLPNILQLRYLVMDGSEIVGGILVLIAIVVIIVSICSFFFGAIFGWSSKDIFFTGLVIGFAGLVIFRLGEIYVDYSHWADTRAVNKGRAIVWGPQPTDKN